MPVRELDASYCFIEGLCSDTEVTHDATPTDAEALCDKRYPDWRSLGYAEVQALGANASALSLAEGFLDAAPSRTFGRLACAMGNYHCDVMYCKDTYCKMPHYTAKYGHWLQ